MNESGKTMWNLWPRLFLAVACVALSLGFRGVRGEAQKTFTLKGRLIAEGRIFGVASYDFDKDGRPDIVVSDYLNPARVLFNDAGLEFKKVAPLPSTAKTAKTGRGVALADFNGDGDLDLLGAEFDRATGRSDLRLFLNTLRHRQKAWPKLSGPYLSQKPPGMTPELFAPEVITVATDSVILGESQPVTDHDGNVYRTVRIGSQIWMAENLKVTHYRDGTPIPNVPDDDVWSELRTGALCWQGNAPVSSKDVYGALYNYFAVIDARGLSPAGWHIPTIEEWRVLENELGGREVAGDQMKDIASKLWEVIRPGTNDASGFSARPAGGRGRFGSAGEAGRYATWWSATSHDPDFAWHWGLFPNKGAIRSNPGHKASGFSVRCVKDP